MKKILPRTIETARLVIREPELSDDVDMFNNWASDPEVTKYLTWRPHETVSVTRMILQLWSSSNGEERSVNWIIEDKNSGQAIGTIGLLNIEDKSRQCSIGYCLSKKFWHQGLMTEAVNAVLQFAFKMGMKTIIGYHDSRNTASGKVMMKNKMLYFESINAQSLVDNSNIVLDYYKITSQDWKKIYGRKKD